MKSASVKVEHLPDCQVRLEFEAEPERVKRAYDETYRDLNRGLRIPGFRPGKAPAVILRQRLGADKIGEYATSALVEELVGEAIREHDLRPLESDKLDETVRAAEGEPFSFSLKMTVQPRPKLGELEGIPVRLPEVEPSGKQVQKRLDEIAQGAARWAEVEEGEIARGDSVTVDVEVTPEDGETVIWHDQEYIVGEGETRPALDEALIGGAVDVSLTIDTEFPDDYEDESVAGKKAKVTLTPALVERLRTPEFDDALAQELGADSAAALREQVTEELREANKQLRRRVAQQQLLEQVLKEAEVEVAPQYVSGVAEKVVARTREAAGGSFDAALEDAGASEDDLFQEEAERTESHLKRMFVLDGIAEQQEIAVAEEDIRAELQRIADEREVPVSVLEDQVADSAESRRSLVRLLRDRKVFDHLLERANVTDVPIDAFLAEMVESEGTEDAEQ